MQKTADAAIGAAVATSPWWASMLESTAHWYCIAGGAALITIKLVEGLRPWWLRRRARRR